jgi:hypothetical protein
MGRKSIRVVRELQAGGAMTVQTQPTRATPRPQTPLDRMADRLIDAIASKDADKGQVWREKQKLAGEG